MLSSFLIFNILNESNILEGQGKDNKEFIIQAFGCSKTGKSYCFYIKNFNPFFYIKVDDKFTKKKKERFLEYIKEEIGNYYS